MKHWAAIGTCTLAVACSVATEMPTRGEGQAVFAENCAVCHGAGGRGDGEAAAAMSPPPADLTTIAARSGGTFPRAQVLSTIDGYYRAPVPGVEMPEFGALLSGETVPVDTGDGVLTPTPRPLAALMVYLEGIQR